MAEVILKNSVYDKLKHVTLVGLPALGSLYAGLAVIWHFPAGEEVVGSISLLTTFFGLLLKTSSKNYNAGQGLVGELVLETQPNGHSIAQLQFDDDLPRLADGDEIAFKVVDVEEQNNHEFWDHPDAE